MDLVVTQALPLFLGLAVLFITQLEWRCTQTYLVIFLDNFAQFQDSAVLCQDLSVLATFLRVVNTLDEFEIVTELRPNPVVI